MKLLPITLSLLLGGISACGTDNSSGSKTDVPPGSDRDEHGCIGSAGYMWCERSEKCERPWELAEQQGFENTEAEFEAYCAE